MQFVSRQQEVPIGGVRVKFPFKPYPSQISMMAKIIQALNRGDNALLESPTGTGKSLALLCSCLAWQAQQLEKSQGEAKVAAKCTCPCHVKSEPPLAGSSVQTPCQNVIKTEACVPGSTPCQNVIKTEACVPGSTPCQSGLETPSVLVVVPGSSGVASHGGEVKVKSEEDGEGEVKGHVVKAEVDEDFRKPQKRYRTPSGAASQKGCKRSRLKGVVYEEEEEEVVVSGDARGQPTWKVEIQDQLPATQPSVMDTGLQIACPAPSTPLAASTSPSPCITCQCASLARQQRKSAVLKVYFGTRTHQQVAQITHELAKTAYTSTPMCILGSRERACIHPDVSRSRKKNEDCKKLLDGSEGGSCSFYYCVAKKLGSQAQLLQHGLSTAWDMEDFVALGKRVKACPYFALRGIKEEAQIIFCPYNYLIDPLIRDQMLIDLQGQVVVLDEAHNMEDVARDAASQTVTSAQLEEVSSELRDILNERLGELKPSFEYLLAISTSVKSWIASTVSTLPQQGFEQSCGIWSGQDFVPILRGMGINPSTPRLITNHITSIMDAVNEQKQREQREEKRGKQPPNIPSPSMATVSVLKGLAMVLSYLFRDEMRYTDDYRMSLMRTTVTKDSTHTADGWRRRRRGRVPERVWLYSLHFWCLNPSVAFSDLSCARSVVLTSGTLSPLSSFSSELGMGFSVQMEANHVVSEAQTFIRSVSHGPNGRVLCANYQNSETYEFQDEIGAVVEQVCQTVPNGVLCFFSSYKMLNKLTERWKVTGMWGKIEQRKVIVVEPHGSNKSEFEEAIKQFYTTIESTQHGHSVPGSHLTSHMTSHMTGALFLAVCRGKVSEGLDFADSNARAVITIGIPYPSIKDKQVELKREYNNQYSRERGLLSGSEWYEIQAFRAINQALGRCIRHKRDWGALILVDERFSKGHRYTRGLSKWIRQRVTHEADFASAMRALAVFSENMRTGDSPTDTSEMETSLSFANSSSTVLYPTQDLSSVPLPGSTPFPVTSSTPTPLAAASGKTRWLPPYLQNNTQQQQQQHHQHHQHHQSQSVHSLSTVISQLRAFQYPGRAQDGGPGRAQDGGPGRAQDGGPGRAQDGGPGRAQDGGPGRAQDGGPGRAQDGGPGRAQDGGPGRAQDGGPGRAQDGGPGRAQDGGPGRAQDGGLGRAQDGRAQDGGPGRAQDGGLGRAQDGRAQDGGVVPVTPLDDSLEITCVVNPTCAADHVVVVESSPEPAPSSHTTPSPYPSSPLLFPSNEGMTSTTSLHHKAAADHLTLDDPTPLTLHTVTTVPAPTGRSTNQPSHQAQTPLSPTFPSRLGIPKTPLSPTFPSRLGVPKTPLSPTFPSRLGIPKTPLSPTFPSRLGVPKTPLTALLPAADQALAVPESRGARGKSAGASVSHAALEPVGCSVGVSAVEEDGGEVDGGEEEEGGGESSDDPDATPPLSPAEPTCHPSEGEREGGRLASLAVLETSSTGHRVLKASTPLQRTRANTRMASRKRASQSCCMASANGREVMGDGEGDSKDCKTGRNSGSTQSTFPVEVARAAVSCSCGQNITGTAVKVERLELKEAFSRRLGKVKVHQVQTSRLWGYMKAEGVGRVAHTHLLSAADVTCREREDSSPHNAVWDKQLGLCYSLLECACGCRVGVKVHMVLDPDTMGSLIGKVLLSVEKTRIHDAGFIHSS